MNTLEKYRNLYQSYFVFLLLLPSMTKLLQYDSKLPQAYICAKIKEIVYKGITIKLRLPTQPYRCNELLVSPPFSR